MIYKRGANPFQDKQFETHYKFIKPKTWVLIYIVLILMGLLMLIAVKTEKHKLISPLAITPNVIFADYRIPTLNPDLTEREQNIQLIKKIWGKDSNIGLELARCESGYRTSGVHAPNNDGTVDQGVFSINSVHGMPEMENAVANISYAYLMFLKQGLQPWDSSSMCWTSSLKGNKI